MIPKPIILSGFVLFLAACSTTSNSPKEPISFSSDTSITYAQHIAPILYKNCVACHRPSEAGPFNLLTYKDAAKNANKIKFVTQTRYMPPWPADPNYTHFIGERTLSKKEILLITQWVQQGVKLGDSTKIPPLPTFYQGSFFGKPDLVIKLQEPVFLKGKGADHFLTIKLPYTISKDTFIRCFEFVPNQRKFVHHVNGHLISYNDNRKFNHFKGASTLPDVRSKFKEQFYKMNLNYTDKLQPEFPLLTPNTVYYLPGYTHPYILIILVDMY